MAARPSPALRNAVAAGVRVDRIEPIQARIPRNRVRFVVFMALFVLSVSAAAALTVGLVASIAGILGVFTIATRTWMGPADAGEIVARATVVTFYASLVITAVWSLYRLSRSETRLLERLGARMPAGGTLAGTKSALRDMAIAAGLAATPRFYVIDTDGVNAFVLGRSPATARIGVTRGMLERITVDEQRAVFANLIARVLSRDTLWATAVSALVGPIWAMREHDLRREPEPAEPRGAVRTRSETDAAGGLMSVVVYGFVVLATELLAWYHREAAWTAAEKADAEGMMLLKDPRSMLSAIERVLERNNHVPSAGDAYSTLFFCWSGFGFAPEQDPEMRRVARLREVLGAEGAAYAPRPNVPGWPSAPVAPRIELLGGIAGREDHQG